MGNKGRDLVVWLFYLALPFELIYFSLFKSLPEAYFFGLAVLALYLGKYQFVDVPRARARSKQAGLKNVVLVPLNNLFTRLLLFREPAVGLWKKAYEIHFEVSGAVDPKRIRDDFEADLLYIERGRAIGDTSGYLFIWETKLTIPQKVRKMVRQREAEGKGFWLPGGYLPPPPPFVSVNLKQGKKCIRRGAIVI